MQSATPTHTSQRRRPAKKLAEIFMQLGWAMKLLFRHFKRATPTMEINWQKKGVDDKFLLRISMFILCSYNLDKQLTCKKWR